MATANKTRTLSEAEIEERRQRYVDVVGLDPDDPSAVMEAYLNDRSAAGEVYSAMRLEVGHRDGLPPARDKELRAAMQESGNWHTYVEHRSRRDAAALLIDADRERYADKLRDAGIRGSSFEADIKSANRNVDRQAEARRESLADGESLAWNGEKVRAGAKAAKSKDQVGKDTEDAEGARSLPPVLREIKAGLARATDGDTSEILDKTDYSRQFFKVDRGKDGGGQFEVKASSGALNANDIDEGIANLGRLVRQLATKNGAKDEHERIEHMVRAEMARQKMVKDAEDLYKSEMTKARIKIQESAKANGGVPDPELVRRVIETQQAIEEFAKANKPDVDAMMNYSGAHGKPRKEAARQAALMGKNYAFASAMLKTIRSEMSSLDVSLDQTLDMKSVEQRERDSSISQDRGSDAVPQAMNGQVTSKDERHHPGSAEEAERSRVVRTGARTLYAEIVGRANGLEDINRDLRTDKEVFGKPQGNLHRIIAGRKRRDIEVGLDEFLVRDPAEVMAERRAGGKEGSDEYGKISKAYKGKGFIHEDGELAIPGRNFRHAIYQQMVDKQDPNLAQDVRKETAKMLVGSVDGMMAKLVAGEKLTAEEMHLVRGLNASSHAKAILDAHDGNAKNKGLERIGLRPAKEIENDRYLTNLNGEKVRPAAYYRSAMVRGIAKDGADWLHTKEGKQAQLGYRLERMSTLSRDMSEAVEAGRPWSLTKEQAKEVAAAYLDPQVAAVAGDDVNRLFGVATGKVKLPQIAQSVEAPAEEKGLKVKIGADVGATDRRTMSYHLQSASDQVYDHLEATIIRSGMEGIEGRSVWSNASARVEGHRLSISPGQSSEVGDLMRSSQAVAQDQYEVNGLRVRGFSPAEMTNEGRTQLAEAGIEIKDPHQRLAERIDGIVERLAKGEEINPQEQALLVGAKREVALARLPLQELDRAGGNAYNRDRLLGNLIAHDGKVTDFLHKDTSIARESLDLFGSDAEKHADTYKRRYDLDTPNIKTPGQEVRDRVVDRAFARDVAKTAEKGWDAGDPATQKLAKQLVDRDYAHKVQGRAGKSRDAAEVTRSYDKAMGVALKAPLSKADYSKIAKQVTAEWHSRRISGKPMKLSPLEARGIKEMLGGKTPEAKAAMRDLEEASKQGDFSAAQVLRVARDPKAQAAMREHEGMGREHERERERSA